jgi:outer membrane protein TolC
MRHWLVIATLAAGAWLAGTSSSGAQTLGDALVAAYLTNSDLQAQRAALRSTDELVPQALSGWRPTLSIDNTLAHTQAEVSSGGSSGDASFSEKGSSLTLAASPFSNGSRPGRPRAHKPRLRRAAACRRRAA